MACQCSRKKNDSTESYTPVRKSASPTFNGLAVLIASELDQNCPAFVQLYARSGTPDVGPDPPPLHEGESFAQETSLTNFVQICKDLFKEVDVGRLVPLMGASKDFKKVLITWVDVIPEDILKKKDRSINASELSMLRSKQDFYRMSLFFVPRLPQLCGDDQLGPFLHALSILSEEGEGNGKLKMTLVPDVRTPNDRSPLYKYDLEVSPPDVYIVYIIPASQIQAITAQIREKLDYIDSPQEGSYNYQNKEGGGRAVENYFNNYLHVKAILDMPDMKSMQNGLPKRIMFTFDE